MKKKSRPKTEGTRSSDPISAGKAESATPAPPVCRPAPWWVKVFVPFHILAITVYALPLLPPARLKDGKPTAKWYQVGDRLLYENENGTYIGKNSPLIYPYLMETGFWQYWDMFAPDPVQSDVYGSATVVYKDGRTRNYQYPRMYLESVVDKYLDERYRKFFERVHDYAGMHSIAGSKPYVAQRFAQRIALLNDDDPANPPVEVKLFLHSWDIPPPGQPIRPEYKSVEYFDYVVEQDQLAKDKAASS